MDAIFAFLTNLCHNMQLEKREMLCPQICEQRLDVHLFGFPNQQGLQALHCASQDLVHLQDFAKYFKELDRKEDQCFDQYVARKLRAWFTMFL